MATVEIVEYGVIFAVTLIFSMIAINFKKEEVHYKFVAGICWLVLAVAQFIVGDIDSPLTWAIGFFWFGFFLLFTILAIQDFFNMKKDKIWGFGD